MFVFSEDMDFQLLQKDTNFNIDEYLKGIEQELGAYELKVTAAKTHKSIETPIESAFIKCNTLAVLLSIDTISNPLTGTHRNELLKIKLEIDTDPPVFPGNSEVLFLTTPIPFSFVFGVCVANS